MRSLRSILLTGGAGFIGSALTRALLKQPHLEHLVILDSLTYAGNRANLIGPDQDPRLNIIEGDIGDEALASELIEKFRCSGIMHLAAESHVDKSIDGPGDFIDTNIIGTFNMLEAARKYWQAAGRPDSFRFHPVSTDEVFGSLPADPAVQFTEATAYDPRSPYSASKAASDHLVRAWFETYGLPVC